MQQINIIENIEIFSDPKQWMGCKFTMSNPDNNIITKIDNVDKCCEKWGIYTYSILNDFIGAEYNSISIFKEIKDEYDEMRILNITISTNRGDIIIYFYNQHNGYYSHDVFIQSKHTIKFIRL